MNNRQNRNGKQIYMSHTNYIQRVAAVSTRTSLSLSVTGDCRHSVNELGFEQHVGIFEHSVFQRHHHKLQTATKHISRLHERSDQASANISSHGPRRTSFIRPYSIKYWIYWITRYFTQNIFIQLLSHQFVISFITTITIHYSFSLTTGSKLIFSINHFLHSSSTFPPIGLTPRYSHMAINLAQHSTKLLLHLRQTATDLTTTTEQTSYPNSIEMFSLSHFLQTSLTRYLSIITITITIIIQVYLFIQDQRS